MPAGTEAFGATCRGAGNCATGPYGPQPNEGAWGRSPRTGPGGEAPGRGLGAKPPDGAWGRSPLGPWGGAPAHPDRPHPYSEATPQATR
ncbi:hypothetical protein GCM10010331_65620 [Streptomyces xanthochromogenes]|nr:hypothetical protein GCM10010331_65620 [Streptomyces xanthochromogenes]